MQAVKVVVQRFTPNDSLRREMIIFRAMTNDCIRIGLESGATSLKTLSLKAYHQLDQYKTPSAYKLNAISRAVGLLRNYRKNRKRNPSTKTPYVRRLMLTSCYGVKMKDGVLRLPYGEEVKLNLHTLEVLASHTVRSVTLTSATVSVSYAEEVALINPQGVVGVDRNLDNVTIADNEGLSEHIDLSKATAMKERYRSCKRALKRNDVRVRRRLCGKYGLRQSVRVRQLLHRASKYIVAKARESKSLIAMEKLTHLRRLYRKGNWQGYDYRAKMNGWSYYELQRQIEYKARWEGIPVLYVNAGGTSKKCSLCGSNMEPEENRILKYASCGLRIDRDINAARNIAVKGLLRFDSPQGQQGEAMMPERPSVANLDSRLLEATSKGT